MHTLKWARLIFNVCREVVARSIIIQQLTVSDAAGARTDTRRTAANQARIVRAVNMDIRGSRITIMVIAAIRFIRVIKIIRFTRVNC